MLCFNILIEGKNILKKGKNTNLIFWKYWLWYAYAYIQYLYLK